MIQEQTQEYKPKISEKKLKDIEDIKQFAKKYKVIAIANMEKLPAFNLMKIKAQLREKITLKYAKKRIIKIALDEINDKKLNSLKERLEGIPALIFTNEDPFKLFQLIKKSKTPAPAKAGDKAPKDIVIQAGPTDFAPGPMIGELGALGIKTSVEGGKIAIKSEKLLVKAGEEINPKQAELMTKLGLQPMEIGMNIVLTYQNGEFLEKQVLDIDTDKIFEDLKKASSDSIALAIHVSYITKETINLLIKKAQLEALSLEKKYEEKVPLEAKESKQEQPEIKQEIKTQETAQQNEQTQVQKQETQLEKQNVPQENKESPKKEETKEPYDQRAANEKMMKLAQDKLKELTLKKIKGEI